MPRDYDKARKYHMQAAEAGDPRSMFDLGSMYEFGLGVTIDLKQAAVWYGHAADYGHAQGAYNLATMLESGVYLAPSQFEACFISAAHTDADIDETIAAARAALAQIR